MKKTVIIGVAFGAFHLVEDFMWVTLGRFTDLSLPIIISAIIFLGVCGGLFFQIPFFKRFIGS